VSADFDYLIEIMRKIPLRDHLFFFLDKILPRPLAVYPYREALGFLHLRFLQTGLPVEVWHRNSIYRGNYVFGLSDLDVTVYFASTNITSKDLQAVKSILLEAKRIYPFLGECNFYVEGLAMEFIASANYFEISRDKLLTKELKISSTANSVDRIVFILRMFYSDRVKLSKYPYLRQRKWSAHLEDVFSYTSGNNNITAQTVIQLLMNEMNLTKESQLEVEHVFKELLNNDFKDEEVYGRKMSEMWKYIFPHRHAWSEDPSPEEIEKIKETILGPICLRQIDWEVWGLLGQLPFLSNKETWFRIHLTRLQKVVTVLDESSDINARIEKLLLLDENLS
jgi:hypothetical protein